MLQAYNTYKDTRNNKYISIGMQYMSQGKWSW